MEAEKSLASALFDLSEDELAGQQLAQMHLNNASCTLLEPDAPELAEALRLRSEDFSMQDERACLVQGAGDGADALAGALRANLLKTEYKGQDLTLVAMVLRSGFALRGIRVAVHLRCADGAELVLLFSNVGGAINAAVAAFVRSACGRLDAQVYRTPTGALNNPKADGYWGQHWTADDAADYLVYRERFDAMLEEALVEAVGDRSGLTIVEPCAGDGALAASLLSTPWAQKRVTAYVLSERNATLAARAKERLAGFPAAKFLHADAADASAYGPPDSTDVVICAGAVLNGQVGAYAEADRALAYMAQSLSKHGVLIATGVSSSWLHPMLLRRHGLNVVVRGSQPTERTKCTAAPAGVDHGWERCQCLVVRKRKPFDKPCHLFDALAGGST